MINADEIEDIKSYFALQLTRREFYLYNIIKECLKGIKKDIESFDLLDYLYCKYIYNKSLLENFNNWLEYVKSKNKVYQIQYKQCIKNIAYQEAFKLQDSLKETEYTNSNLAITETHTFIVKEFIESVKIKHVNRLLVENGLSKLTQAEINLTNDIIVTIGSDDKLCYLMSQKPNKELFNKINFMVHTFWDKCMMHAVLVNLLINKNSKLNNINYFKRANISKQILNRAKFMYDIFESSKSFEETIKKESIIFRQPNLT